MAAISHKTGRSPIIAPQITTFSEDSVAFLLTFDDGGVSSFDVISKTLDRYAWKAHFFIPTDFINRPGFMDRRQIRDLRQKGNIIGSHSCSHPRVISACTEARLLEEWKKSVDVLSEITDAEITTASVPGGYYSRKVALTASAAGIRVLFTSEPTTRLSYVGECLVIGRYSITANLTSREVGDIACHKLVPRIKQTMIWKMKGAAKRVNNRLYMKLRRTLLAE